MILDNVFLLKLCSIWPQFLLNHFLKNMLKVQRIEQLLKLKRPQGSRLIIKSFTHNFIHENLHPELGTAKINTKTCQDPFLLTIWMTTFKLFKLLPFDSFAKLSLYIILYKFRNFPKYSEYFVNFQNFLNLH